MTDPPGATGADGGLPPPARFRPFLDAAVGDDATPPGGFPERRAVRPFVMTSGRVDRAQLKRFVQQAHQIQLGDPAVQAELAAFTGHRPGATDGVPPASAGVRPEMQDEWVFRDFHGPQRHPGKDYESDPLVVVLCSFYDGPLGDLQAGQAMQRVLLTATTHGLSASFLSQPVEVRRVREELRRSLGGMLIPQTVLRLGFGAPVPPTPRRSVSELLLSDEHAACQ